MALACLQSYDEFESLYMRASASRKTSATHLNVQSSRSHAVLMIKVRLHFSQLQHRRCDSTKHLANAPIYSGFSMQLIGHVAV